LPLAALSEEGFLKSGMWFPSTQTELAADPERGHPGMCMDLRKEPKAFDNPMVQVDELSLAQPVNIGPFHSGTVG
jgi:hypothetical protein